MESLFQLLIKILFFTSGYGIKVDYLRGVPRLGNSSFWDYYFNCNTEGQTLQWEVNGNSLGGFLTEDVGQAFSSSRSNFDYVATLLSATPASGIQYNFVSVLIVSSLGYSDLEVICRSDLSMSMTNNTENRTNIEDMTNTSLISLQYLLNEEIVSTDRFRIRIFVCGVDYFFLNWQTDIKICTFTTSDRIGQNRPALTQSDTTVLQQALFIAHEPYPIVSILLVTGNLDVNVKCRNSEGILQFSFATTSTGTENEPISTELHTGRPVGTNTTSIVRVLLVAIVPSAVVPILAIIIVVVVGTTCKTLYKKRKEKKKKNVNPQSTKGLQEKNEECVNPKDKEEEEDEKQELRKIYLQPKYVKDFKKERKKKSIKYEYEFLIKESTVSSTREAQKHGDKKRYPKVFPYDSTRVKLGVNEGVECSDYLNAYYIDGYEKNSIAYIAAQSPMSNTIDDFWRMIYEEQVTTIVMCGKRVEKLYSKNKELKQVYGNIHVTCKKIQRTTHYEVRDFILDMDKESGSHDTKYCKHYRFFSWPANGVPQFPTPLIQFIREIKFHHQDSDTSPIVVHSGGGIGRAGVFIALHAIMGRIENDKDFVVFKYVNEMRSQRMHMVMSRDEYLFIYNVLHEVCICNDGKTSAMNAHALRKKIKDSLILKKPEFKFLEGCIDNWIKEMSPKPIRLYDDDNHSLSSTYEAFSIHGYKQENAYIAAPIPTSRAKKNDFWHLLWQKQSQVIVVLEPLQDYDPFWPGYEPETYDVKLSVSLHEKVIFKDYTIRICHIRSLKTDNILVVTIYQYESWPDYTPSSSKISGIVKFISELELNIPNYDHIVVMSWDGEGHTGTFITIHAMIERVQIDNMVDFFQFIMLSRIHGYKLIEHLKHYVFCHDVLAEYMKNM